MKTKLVSCILGVLIIIIGIIVIVKLILLCKKLFPDTPTDPEPNATNVVYNAWITASGARSLAPDAFNSMNQADDSCSFSFQLLLGADGLCLTNCSVPGMVSGTTFSGQLDAIGLDANRTSYNGQTDPAEIYYANGTVRVGEGVTAVIEQTLDHTNWLPVLTNTFSAGQILSLTIPVPCQTNAFFRAVSQ